MFTVMNKETATITTVYAVSNDLFLVNEDGEFCWLDKNNYAPIPQEAIAVKEPANKLDANFALSNPAEKVLDVCLTTRHETRLDLPTYLARLKNGEIMLKVGDFFTTCLKNGQEVDFVCTDVDDESYRFESRDCFGRYDPMMKIQDFYDWVMDELPDVLRDSIIETIRVYKTSDGKLKNRKCKLFLPSASEIFPSDECYGDKGVYEQLEYYKDAHNRIRAYKKGGDADWYWTQSACSGTTAHWCSVYFYGLANGNSASNTNSAAPVCFRIPRF